VIVFGAYGKASHNFEYFRHRVRTISLSFGAQGVPNGFNLTATCGAEQEFEREIDLDGEVNAKDCPECFLKDGGK
jgi:hypothetical protein